MFLVNFARFVSSVFEQVFFVVVDRWKNIYCNEFGESFKERDSFTMFSFFLFEYFKFAK